MPEPTTDPTTGPTTSPTTGPTTSGERLVPRRPPAAPDRWATVTPLASRRPPSVSAPVDGSLALAATGVGRRAPASPGLRVVGDTEPPEGPEVRQWSARFAQALVEVLGGDRPLTQLLRWTSERVYCDIDRRLRLLHGTSGAAHRRRTVRPQVRSVHVCHPTATSAEVSVHVRHGRRSRALAARLELRGGRWQCTALQLG